ncbi:nitrile hydratase [Acuticoccus sediminis]|uniref:Nitrile hydratase n=1 Tax=Acuticoccus sediminis TaxID=2184697 RepID=A0A8B2NUP8_9HYPH|nr:SH3-like domain-containing protein [Acuticoccus sediminis]RAI02229.1 nitrile hydratase [Acuticoccus sediminis]
MTEAVALAPGTVVHVLGGPPEPHCRTPHYLRGKTGVVDCELGIYPDPTRLAYHKPGLPKRRLYRVQFSQAALWPGYPASGDTLYADLYEHWLQPASVPTPRQG